MLESYFVNRILEYENHGANEVPGLCQHFHGLVLGPFLWNIMYDGIWWAKLQLQLQVWELLTI